MKLAISRSISTQLTLLTCGIVAVAVTIISAVAYLRSAAALDRRWNEDLATQVRLVEMQFETFDTVARENAERLLHVFQNMLGGAVRVDDTRTMQVGGHAAPLVTGAGGVLNLDFSQVDAFARMTGGTATVFARVGDDFLRVTTSLKKQDGTRALGTFLGKGHPGYQKLLRGEGFGGRAKLFGREYMTQYLPVRDGSGRTTAILYVGFDMTGAMNALFEGISRHRVGEGGYYFVIDALNRETGGELRVHPQAVGKAVDAAPELTPFADVLRQQKGMFTNGGELYVFQDFPDWKLTFGATIGLDELRAEAAWMRNVSLLSGLLVIALGCALTYFVVTRKLKPLADLARDAERIGAGDLTVRSGLEATDEIGEVAGAFNRMADQVQELVLRMKGLVDGLKAAVNSVRVESERVREGSESQSEAASRAAAALEEVTASLGHVSENARDSRRLSERTNELSEQGQSVAERAAGETAAIATTVREAADRIAALSERSDQISEVVKVIKDIADQTNLLALNAAIEAARAGEQGRGFAVVADEVRKLAERTSQATIEIGTMISSIQTETGGAVQGMETSSGRVEEGVRLVREALEALQEIRRAAAETCEKAGEISHAMTEQSVASTEISSNVENIAEMAERNTTAALRNQDTVRELETLATDLVALTARLRVA